MKTFWMRSALVTVLGLSATVTQAEQHTFSLGYAQSKVQDWDNINGVNLKYRYEWDSPISVIGSFTYMGGDKNHSYLAMKDIINGKVDAKYYSLSVGPAYRFNQYVSLYALLGFSYNKVKYSLSRLNYESGSYRYMGTKTGNIRKTSFMYGAGVQLNPMGNLTVDIGYEGVMVDAAGQSHSINGFNIGIGYRF